MSFSQFMLYFYNYVPSLGKMFWQLDVITIGISSLYITVAVTLYSIVALVNLPPQTWYEHNPN